MLHKQILELENDGLNMAVHKNHLYIRHGKNLSKYEYPSMKKAACTQIFKKSGKARLILASENKIYLRDFCDLYEIDADSLETLHVWKLGANASSDICAVGIDSTKIYACMRGGSIKTIDRTTREIEEFQICECSAWDIFVSDTFLYIGTVSGELFKISKFDMTVHARNALHKKNIYSVFLHGGSLFTTSQDGAIQISNAENLEVVHTRKKAITNMSTITGIYRDCLFTSNPNKNEVSIWNKDELALLSVVPFPTGGLANNGIILHNHILIGSDSAGIYSLDTDEI